METLFACTESSITGLIFLSCVLSQLLLSTKVDPQCIVIVDTKNYVRAGYKLSTFFVWSLSIADNDARLTLRKNA